MADGTGQSAELPHPAVLKFCEHKRRCTWPCQDGQAVTSRRKNHTRCKGEGTSTAHNCAPSQAWWSCMHCVVQSQIGSLEGASSAPTPATAEAGAWNENGRGMEAAHWKTCVYSTHTRAVHTSEAGCGRGTLGKTSQRQMSSGP